MPVGLDQFVKNLTDSGVLSAGKLEHFLPPKASPKSAEELAKELVRQKQLTKYQAAEIYQGRAKSLILGNYTILDKIGAGGMGQVFKAQHRRMDRIVAIKMLPKNLMRDAATVARFEREVRAAAKLEHPNIVTAYDADEASGLHFLVMQFADGQDLSALVKKDGPLPVAKAVNYILQAARGLEFAHGEGVIHRDIKPANLLLDKKGTVKILDMGLARIEAGGNAATQAELTGTGAVMGTVDYMAPEQGMSTKHADARADIYSLGCSLHYLLIGKPVYDGETLTAKLLAHHNEPIPDLGKLRNDVPAELDAVFKKMVAKKVEDRYKTMSEVVAALEMFGTGSQVSLSIQQSGSTNANQDVATFLGDAPARKTLKPKPNKKPASDRSGKRYKKFILGAVGSGLLGLAILAGVIFKLRAKDGTLVVEIDQPDATVEVLNEEGKVEITRPGEKGTITISVDPGKHRLKVSKDGFDAFGEEIEIEKGGTRSIAAKLIPLAWNPPAFQDWMKGVANLTAEKQVTAVAKKLVELNPEFDGKVEKKIEGGSVTELQFLTDAVTDVSPVRALATLKSLTCRGSGTGNGKLSDLSPLKGLQLTELDCRSNPPLADLSPLQAMPFTKLNCDSTGISTLSALKGMPLTLLWCGVSKVSDLSPLRGTPLTGLNCSMSNVSDLSPLAGMPLEWLAFDVTKVSDLTPLKTIPLRAIFCDFKPERDTDILRSIKTLEEINTKPAADFWNEVEAAAKTAPDQTNKPWNTPAFLEWQKDVAKLPAEEQVKAVAKKLQELNPGFDGSATPKIEAGVVTGLQFVTDKVADISPVRALVGLKSLTCNRNQSLSDLSPLQGMKLTELDCSDTQVSDLTPLNGMPLQSFSGWRSSITDLTPLNGMPLTSVNIDHTQVRDLSPLSGMRLTVLQIDHTGVVDLSPIAGMPLVILHCRDTQISDLKPLIGMPCTELFVDKTLVSDLSPLANMKLQTILITPANITTGMEIVRRMNSLTLIGAGWAESNRFTPAEFWRKYDAGEFSR